MALQTEIYLSGRVQNLVFYKSGGQRLVRSIPEQVNQSPATRIRSRNFGLAAAAGRMLRSRLAPVIPFPKDKKMQSLFSGTIARWLGLQDAATLPAKQPLEALQGFSFNTQIAWTDRCRVPFSISTAGGGELQITIPAFIPTDVFSAPAGTQQVELIFSVACCGLLQADDRNGHTQELQVLFSNQQEPGQMISFPVTVQQGTLSVLAVAARFINETGMADTRPVFLPAAVIWAGYF
ncbi:MAG: hypothetical protein JSU05_13130 [Bacteroidetes bacterium]|nr:hypothetical protein [Bacteroidota bacterium]